MFKKKHEQIGHEKGNVSLKISSFGSSLDCVNDFVKVGEKRQRDA